MKEVRQIAEQVEKFSIGPQQDLRPQSEMTKFSENPQRLFCCRRAHSGGIRCYGSVFAIMSAMSG